MKALLIKDFRTIAVFFVFIALFALLSSVVGTSPYLSFIYVFLIPMTLLNQDELTHFSRLSSMMPISCAEAVFEKYLMTLIGLAFAVVFALAGAVIGHFVLSAEFSVDGLLLPLCMVLAYCAIVMPFNFLVHSQVGRTVTLVVSALIVGVFVGLLSAGLSDDFAEAFLVGRLGWVVRAGLLVVCAALFAVSVPISIAIYRRKDK